MTATTLTEPARITRVGSAPAAHTEVQQRLEAMRAAITTKQTEQPLDPDWLFGEAYFERRKEDA